MHMHLLDQILDGLQLADKCIDLSLCSKKKETKANCTNFVIIFDTPTITPYELRRPSFSFALSVSFSFPRFGLCLKL